MNKNPPADKPRTPETREQLVARIMPSLPARASVAYTATQQRLRASEAAARGICNSLREH